MARKNYLVKGLSGTGKSAVRQELSKRGYNAIEGDTEFGYYDGAKEFLNFKWDTERAKFVLGDQEQNIAFICGGSMNDKEFLPFFTKVFSLRVDNEILKNRLLNRPDGDWQNRPEDMERLLGWNTGIQSKKDVIVIDATQPIEKVVDGILEYLK